MRGKREISIKNVGTEIWVVLFLSILVFIISMKSQCNFWRNGQSFTDSSVFKYIALVMSNGGMPYRDTFDHKGPLLYILNYVGNRISYYRGIWIIEFAFIGATVVSFYKIARLFCNHLYACFFLTVAITPIMEYFGGGNYSEEYAMPFIAFSIYIFIDYFLHQKISKLRLIICGICFGAVLMLRPNMIATWMVFCIAVLFWNIKKNKQIPWSFLLYFMIGSAIAVVPLMIWLIMNGAFGDFVYDYLIFNMKYVDKQASLYGRCESALKWAGNSIFLISGVSLVYLIRNGNNVFLNVTYLVYEIITLLFVSMSGASYEHYGMVLLPVYVYPLAALSDFMRKNEKNNSSVVVLSIVLLLLVSSDWKNNIEFAISSIHNPHANVQVSKDMQTVLDIIDEYVAPEEKIQVIGNYDFVYVMSQREAASKYSYQVPIAWIDESIENEFKNDMREKLPCIVIVDDYSYDGKMNLFVTQEDYELIYVADDKMGVYKLRGN